jgi:hypothetical protein
MKLSLKLLGILWLGLLIMIGALLYNAYSRIQPDNFVSVLSRQIESNYPGSKVHIGKLGYRFSLDFNLELNEVFLKRNSKTLASIGKAEIKVPWWLLLFNNGNAQLNLHEVDIFLDQDASQAPIVKTKQNSSNSLITLALPEYLTDAKYTIRAKNVTIRDSLTGRRFFVLSKLLVREFQQGNNSAFEFNVPVPIKLGAVQVPLELWVFGDVTPSVEQWNINYHGEFRSLETSEKFKIDDLLFKGLATFTPKQLGLNSELNIQIDKKQVGTGEFIANQEGMRVFFKLTEFPSDYFQPIYETIKNPYLSALSAPGSGEIKFHKKFGAPRVKASASLTFAGTFDLTQKENVSGSWKLRFEDSRWEASFISPKGEVSFFRRSFMDMKQNRVTQYNEELGFSGVDLALSTTRILPLSEFMQDASKVFFSTILSFNKCLHKKELFSGAFKYGVTPDQKYFSGDLSNEKSSLNISYSNKNGNSLDVKSNLFPWDSGLQLFAPHFLASNAVITGQVSGRWTNSWHTGDWIMKLNSTGNIDGTLGLFFKNTTALFNLDTFGIKNLSFDGFLKNNILTVSALLLDNAQQVKISGVLNSRQKSVLSLAYPKNKKLRRNFKEVIEPYWLPKENQ